MSNYAIMRMEKIKSRAGLVGRLNHNTRKSNPANADPERTELNWSSGTTAQAMVKYSEKLPDKVRANAVHAVELMFTTSYALSADSRKYLNDCTCWAQGVFGKDNVIHTAHHLDETTPHLQMIVMPLKDGKLNAKHFIGGTRERMSDLQDDFYEKVGKKYGLERGLPASETRAKHRPHTLAAKAAELDERERKLRPLEKNARDYKIACEQYGELPVPAFAESARKYRERISGTVKGWQENARAAISDANGAIKQAWAEKQRYTEMASFADQQYRKLTGQLGPGQQIEEWVAERDRRIAAQKQQQHGVKR